MNWYILTCPVCGSDMYFVEKGWHSGYECPKCCPSPSTSNKNYFQK